jgi:hypothetical protein
MRYGVQIQTFLIQQGLYNFINYNKFSLFNSKFFLNKRHENKRDPLAFLAFGIGQRECLGIRVFI